MKKIIFIATLAIGIVFNACNPMEGIMEEVDKTYADADKDAAFLKDLEIAPDNYTLTDEDYELSSKESVSNYKSFSSYDLPKDYLPEILNKKFSAEDAQAMMVTYDFYSKPATDYDNAYVISEDEYSEMGENYGSFSDEDAAESLIGKLLDRKVYSDEAGSEMTAQYLMYSTNETRYIQVNEDSTSQAISYDGNAVEVTDEIYEATGNGKYKNFYTIDNALEDLTQFAINEGTFPITYSCSVYKNYIETYVVYLFDGINWVAKQSVMPVSESLNYALNEEDISQSYWWADPAIKITLGADDYALYPETASYSNFDLRSGSVPGTDNDKLVEMVGGMLDANYSPVEDQQYLVSYVYYDGSNGVGAMRLIKENGVWSEVTE